MDEGNLLKIISEKYRLKNAGKLIRMEGGERNRVYKISGLDLAVRVYQPTAPLDGVHFEHKLMSLLSEKMSCVIRPLCFEPNKSFFIWDGRPVSVVPFLYGKKPTRGDCENTGFCYEAGKILGLIHRYAAEKSNELPVLSSRVPVIQMDPFYNHMYDWEKACKWLSSTVFSSELPYMKDQLEELWVFIKGLKDMPFIPVHGDYYKGNLLWNGKHITGVLDFDDSRLEWAVYETARSLWEFTRNDSLFIFNQLQKEAYLQGYASVFPSFEYDRELYLKIIKLIRLFEIISTASSMINGDLLGGWDKEGIDYHWTNLM